MGDKMRVKRNIHHRELYLWIFEALKTCYRNRRFYRHSMNQVILKTEEYTWIVLVCWYILRRGLTFWHPCRRTRQISGMAGAVFAHDHNSVQLSMAKWGQNSLRAMGSAHTEKRPNLVQPPMMKWQVKFISCVISRIYAQCADRSLHSWWERDLISRTQARIPQYNLYLIWHVRGWQCLPRHGSLSYNISHARETLKYKQCNLIVRTAA